MKSKTQINSKETLRIESCYELVTYVVVSIKKIRCVQENMQVKNSKSNLFRNTNAWVIKREQIKIRDKYLWQVCLRNKIYTYNNLQVHHIISINIDYSRRLDSDNLITLCTYHHNQAERGLITKEQLLEIIDSPGSK